MSNEPNDENSIVDYLKREGLPSNLAARKVIAERHGIANYTGTAEQNIKLMALLRNPTVSFWKSIARLFGLP